MSILYNNFIYIPLTFIIFILYDIHSNYILLNYINYINLYI